MHEEADYRVAVRESEMFTIEDLIMF